MRKPLVIGIVSELLLVIGLIYITVGSDGLIWCYNPTSLCPQFAVSAPGVFLRYGGAFLIASAVGFLFSLWLSRKMDTTRSGTAS